MKLVRTEALHMRLEGYSYNEIVKKLGVPKSTLWSWLNGAVLSGAAQARLAGRVRQGVLRGLVKRNRLQTHSARERARQTRAHAAKDITSLSKREHMIIGATLYWAEGYKRPKVIGGAERTGHAISFVNSDPDMVRVFVRFLREILEVSSEDIRAAMRLYEHINEKVALRYWITVTNLKESNFRKTTYLISGASKRKRPFNRLPYGTIQIGVYDTAKFHRLMGWIEGLKRQR